MLLLLNIAIEQRIIQPDQITPLSHGLLGER